MLRPATNNLSAKRLNGQICRTGDITAAERTQMFDLMRDHYANVRRNEFDSDLDRKDWVIVARDPGTADIRGFSTQVTYLQQVGGQSIRVLFSGDTIVHRTYWANNPLSQLWGQLALSLIDADREHPLYWFLISKGYKTYRFLPVFFREYFPRYDATTPASIARLISAIASAQFGRRFDPETGVIAALPRSCRLRPTIADITPDRLKNRHVAFFDRVNPGHSRGDELCCLAPLSRENFNQRAYRVIGNPMDLRSVLSTSPAVGQ